MASKFGSSDLTRVQRMELIERFLHEQGLCDEFERYCAEQDGRRILHPKCTALEAKTSSPKGSPNRYARTRSGRWVGKAKALGQEEKSRPAPELHPGLELGWARVDGKWVAL